MSDKLEEYKFMKQELVDIKNKQEEKFMALADEHRDTLRSIRFDKDLEMFNRPHDNVLSKMLEITLARKRKIAKKYSWPCSF
ncbi:hypothetical protein Hanom_Chr01g00005521 [Helianthus anomalus]